MLNILIWSSFFDANRRFLHGDGDVNGVGDGRSFAMSVLVTGFLFNFFGCKRSGNLNTEMARCSLLIACLEL